jgi:hypothetical protein
MRAAAGGRPHAQGYICSYLENREEFFNRSSTFVGIGINTHEKFRFVIVLIMSMQVVRHQAFDIYQRHSQDPAEQLAIR